MIQIISNKALALIVVLMLFIMVGQTECFSLKEQAKFIKQKLDSKIDINPYFLDIFENQQQNKEYLCSYQEGPYCQLLSNATHDIVEDNFYSYNMRNYLKQKMYELQRQISSNQKKQKDFLPSHYYLDKSRAQLDEELFYKPLEKDYPYKLLADFNILEVIESQQNNELKQLYTIHLSTGQQSAQTTKMSKSEFVQIQFTDINFFFPKQQVANKQNQYFDRLDQLNSIPSDAYILTSQKLGKITFNQKVNIISFYAKMNPAYNKYEKLKSYIKGYDLKNKKDLQFDLGNMENQFRMYKIDSDHKMNEIIFSPYLIIDNLVFSIDKADVADQNQYPEVEVNESSKEIQDILNSFEKEIFVHTNYKQPYQDVSNRNNQMKKGVKLTKEERKRKQKETIQKIKEQLPNQIQEQLYKEKDFKPIFDEQKIIQDLQKVIEKLSKNQQEAAYDQFEKQNIPLNQIKKKDEQQSKKNDEDATKKESKINQEELNSETQTTPQKRNQNKEKYEQKQKKNVKETYKNKKEYVKTKPAGSNKNDDEKQNEKEDLNKQYEKLYDEIFTTISQEERERYQQATQEIYDNLRKKYPVELGKLSNKQIDEKILDGSFDDTIYELIDDLLNLIENSDQTQQQKQEKSANKPTQQNNFSSQIGKEISVNSSPEQAQSGNKQNKNQEKQNYQKDL